MSVLIGNILMLIFFLHCHIPGSQHPWPKTSAHFFLSFSFFLLQNMCHHSLSAELKTFVFASTVHFKKLLLGKIVFQIRHQNSERKILHSWSLVTGKSYDRWGLLFCSYSSLPKRLGTVFSNLKGYWTILLKMY